MDMNNDSSVSPKQDTINILQSSFIYIGSEIDKMTIFSCFFFSFILIYISSGIDLSSILAAVLYLGLSSFFICIILMLSSYKLGKDYILILLTDPDSPASNRADKNIKYIFNSTILFFSWGFLSVLTFLFMIK